MTHREDNFTNRVPGYYWVTPAKEWEPGFWTGDYWLITGETDHHGDSDL